jgi:hypothetical protein
VRRGALALSFTLAVAAPAAAAPCGDLAAAKQGTYGFRPSQLSPQAKDAKLRELDTFWDRVKAGGPNGVDCLRAMIRADSSDGYFALNASMLLASLDRSPDSLAAVEVGLARTNLDEVDVASYVRMVIGLIHANRDVEKLAEKYLRHPRVDTRVAQHGGMLLDRDGGGIIMYGSLPPATADRYLAASLRLPEPYARATAAKLLALSLSEPALRALKAFPWKGLGKDDRGIIEDFVLRQSPTASKPGTKTRQEVLAAAARVPNYREGFWGFASNKDLEASAVLRLEAGDLESLREARRRSITGVSDEALGEYFAITRVMLGLVNRLDLYRDLRRP